MRQPWVKIWNTSTGSLGRYNVVIGNDLWQVYGNGRCWFEGYLSEPGQAIIVTKEIKPEDWLTLPKAVRKKIIELFDGYYNNII
jgi:RecA-family ATPase